MSSISTHLMPDAPALLEAHARSMPQKDELCGAFWASLALETLTGTQVTQDEVAIAAGTLLSLSSDAADSLPPGQLGRRDYVLDLPTTPDVELAGTAPGGVLRALEVVSGGSVAGIPTAGPWTEETVLALAALAAAQPRAVLLLNAATRFLWGSHASMSHAIRYLLGEDVVTPPADWDVGHFLGVIGVMEGPGGRLLLCADTYPSLGVRGLHVQPPEAIAESLRREDSSFSGGAILAVPAEVRTAVQRQITDAGLQVELWDNGCRSPQMDSERIPPAAGLRRAAPTSRITMEKS
ncbi:hypothetical protein GCM10022226_24380 [Sphaerisporangium flaviroseum]|uniref:Uncharacterized protein n=1 Tax=Sphaerisporangium flaviroseum TaxID=509199 RepID=A0ABP7HUZ2_9ACTN